MIKYRGADRIAIGLDAVQQVGTGCGCPNLALVFSHEAEVQGSRIPVDSDWAAAPERYSTHAGVEYIGSHVIESWVVPDQIRALSSAEAELYGIVDGSARGIMTQNLMIEIDGLASAADTQAATAGPPTSCLSPPPPPPRRGPSAARCSAPDSRRSGGPRRSR